jgi:hypothetical protein
MVYILCLDRIRHAPAVTAVWCCVALVEARAPWPGSLVLRMNSSLGWVGGACGVWFEVTIIAWWSAAFTEFPVSAINDTKASDTTTRNAFLMRTLLKELWSPKY